MPTTQALTIQQEWLWSLLRENPNWNVVATYTFRLKGSLDVEGLRNSFSAVVTRHGALRTTIVDTNGALSQRIDEPGPRTLPLIEMSGSSRAEIENNATHFIESWCDRPFELGVSPLMSVVIVRLHDDEHWLSVSMHRLIGDCSMAEQVFREVWEVYGESAHARPSSFPESPKQYGDYALWQQQTREQWLKRHGPYWKARLEGAEPLQWLAEQVASVSKPGELGKTEMQFGEPLSSELKELAKKSRTLAATVMLAAYVCVLRRRSGQEDFVVPVMIAGRQTEHKTIVGYFAHILYLRFQLSGASTFNEILGRVSNEFFRALSHDDFGGTAMQEPRLLTGAFFQWVTWHHDELPKLDSLTANRLAIRDFSDGLTAVPPGIVDVEVTFFDTQDGVYGACVYRKDHLTKATVRRFMQEIRDLIQRVVATPNARVIDEAEIVVTP